jgi:hypothetical protein
MAKRALEISRAIHSGIFKPGMSEEEILAASIRASQEVFAEYERLGITAKDISAEIRESMIPAFGSAEEFDRHSALNPVLRGLRAETDRSFAITLAAIIEDDIKACLKRHLTTDPAFAKMLKDAFKDNGILGTFGACIDFLALQSICGHAAWGQLTIIRTIRNRFAHRLHVNSFDHPEIAGQVDNLTFIETFMIRDGELAGIQYRGPTGEVEVTGWNNSIEDFFGTRRLRFQHTCNLLRHGINEARPDKKSFTLNK